MNKFLVSFTKHAAMSPFKIKLPVKVQGTGQLLSRMVNLIKRKGPKVI